MRYLSYVILLFISQATFSQVNKFENAKNWKLYAISELNTFKYSIDTLANFKNIILNKDTMNSFVADISKLPEKNILNLMGQYVTTCELNDGTVVKMDISIYGGFFYDEKDRVFYQLPETLVTKWLNFLNYWDTILQSEK